jgi:hypothetical protein
MNRAVAAPALAEALAPNSQGSSLRANRVVERQFLPRVPEGAAVLDLVFAQRPLHVVLRGGSLRTRPPARDRARRVALDLDNLSLFHVHELSAADGAVRTDRVRDVIRLVDARLQGPRALGLDRFAQTERFALPELAHDRPRLNELREAHCRRMFLSADLANMALTVQSQGAPAQALTQFPAFTRS